MKGTEKKKTRFRWDSKSIAAAQLIAQGDLTLTEIAAQTKVGIVTLWRWRQNEDFESKVQKHLAEIWEERSRLGIAAKHKRIASYDLMWRKLHQVVSDRAIHQDFKDVAGGTTGLLCRTVKGIGKGDDFEVVEVFAVDTGLLKEIRETAKQAAIELGQWDIQDDPDAVDLEGMSDAQVEDHARRKGSRRT